MRKQRVRASIELKEQVLLESLKAGSNIQLLAERYIQGSSATFGIRINIPSFIGSQEVEAFSW